MQLWIAGGIGIAPFLGWLSTVRPDQAERIDLFYSTSTASHAVHLDELQSAAARLPGLTVHVIDTSEQGRLSIDRLEPLLGDWDHPVHAFLCGPKAMVRDLTRGLRARGLDRDHIHAEDFAFR